MPIYEYWCSNNHITQIFVQRIKLGKKKIKCPECGLIAERQISAGGFLFRQPGGTYMGTKHAREVQDAVNEHGKRKDRGEL